jgi:hypothetical protein
MGVRSDTSPQIGTHVEVRRPSGHGDGSFERAVVVDRLTDIAIGLVLEIQFEDAGRLQRVWPSPAIRLLT